MMDLGLFFSRTKLRTKLDTIQMFKLYNRPAIDDAITSGKQLRFSHDPRKYHDCALEWEWNYIKNKLNIDDADKALRLKKDGFWYVTTK